MSSIRPRSVVWIGPAGDPARKATWEVISLFTDNEGVECATLRSGRTGRYGTQPVENLTPFRPRVSEPA